MRTPEAATVIRGIVSVLVICLAFAVVLIDPAQDDRTAAFDLVALVVGTTLGMSIAQRTPR